MRLIVSPNVFGTWLFIDDCNPCWACCNRSDKDGIADDDCEDDVAAYAVLKLEFELNIKKANDTNIGTIMASKQSCILIESYFIPFPSRQI